MVITHLEVSTDDEDVDVRKIQSLRVAVLIEVSIHGVKTSVALEFRLLISICQSACFKVIKAVWLRQPTTAIRVAQESILA